MDEDLSRDPTRGLRHVLLVWALSAPPTLVFILGLVAPLLQRIGIGVAGPQPSPVALLMFLVSAVHWLFTGAAALAAAALSVRDVDGRRKVAAWVAVLVSACASAYIRSTFRF